MRHFQPIFICISKAHSDLDSVQRRKLLITYYVLVDFKIESDFSCTHGKSIKSNEQIRSKFKRMPHNHELQVSYSQIFQVKETLYHFYENDSFLEVYGEKNKKSVMNPSPQFALKAQLRLQSRIIKRKIN